MRKFRNPAYEIDPIYIERWSPRAFSDKEIPKDILYSLFEAARWAPSAANIQPWRFIIARNKSDRDKFLSFINEGNVVWCKHAPVLVGIVSKREEESFGGLNPSHAFDTGTAWGYLSLEATRKGLITHAMGGFNRDEAREILEIPEQYVMQAVVAIGYQGDATMLPEPMQEREKPSSRKEVTEFVFEGKFK
ncbi:nitroreductase family protein [Virgibacillus soli]|uniref:nitroreductase family protein n=1 Tax=Paracerasibacillus soli TaxID=480284 RepID=UPI0035ED7901